ncbi:MAG TPA: glycoside hydrolase domain-containing protein, partial [Planctomycetota bacterium]|nr:glycoside hydrolase domain-containing protein [Planctomycetota bacterium]
RGKFGVTDPARAKDLALEVDYRGGIAVYLNGTEIARQNLPPKPAPGEELLAQPTQPGEKGSRTLRCTLPQRLLHKGINVLAVEVHRAPLLESELHIQLTKWPQGVTVPRATCGVERIRLSAPEAAADAVVPNVARPKGLQVWNSNPLAPDFDQDFGDPFETLRPIRLVGARNGSFSGKVGVGSERPIAKLRGVASDLVADDGRARIDARNVQVRYARPGPVEVASNFRYIEHVNRFKALDEVPPDEVPVYAGGVPKRYALTSPGVTVVPGAVCPVWVTVSVPKDAPPGEYAGTLTLTAEDEKPVRVDVALTVSPWTLPDTKDYVTFAEVVQSPETLALAYNVPLWSDAHFRLIEKSIRLIAQSGGPSVYIPLISETNLGNAESMVRWVRQADGTFTHDFTPMERYLDLVAKHQGKPRVVCFWMWDTFLERTLGGRGDEKWNAGDVVKALEAQKGHGPDVTLVDPKTPQAGQAGKTSKLELPMFTDPQSYRMWRPVADEIVRRMKRRGWLDVTMLGCMCDYQPSAASREQLNRLFPDVKWVSHAHQMPRKDLPMGYAAVVFRSYKDYRDPSVGRFFGWRNPELIAQFPRPMRNWFPITQFRLVNELAFLTDHRGSARWGGDFFEVLADKRGRLQGTIAGRFPRSHWHNLRIEVNFFEKGVEGPVATADYEMFREGVQECEARVVIERALTDKTLREKLGEETAARMQTMLDERSRRVRQGVGTFVQSGHYSQHHTAPSSWWNGPGIVGGQWYSASGWQQRSKELFDAAAEVQAKLKTE